MKSKKNGNYRIHKLVATELFECMYVRCDDLETKLVWSKLK